jgi:hypothetical protein
VRITWKNRVAKWWALPPGLPPAASKKALPVNPPSLPPSNPSTVVDCEKAGAASTHIVTPVIAIVFLIGFSSRGV